jgi:hypothetical protein
MSCLERLLYRAWSLWRDASSGAAGPEEAGIEPLYGTMAMRRQITEADNTMRTRGVTVT